MTDDGLTSEVEALKADIARMRTDLSGLGHTLKDLLAEQAAGGKTTLDEQILESLVRIRRRIEEARQFGATGLGAVEEAVRLHPVRSVLLAFGVGVLIARLLDARGHH